MARAKRTERAEARRRYRAVQLEASGAADTAGTADAPASAAPARRPSGAASSDRAVPGQRYGFLESFKRAYRPVQYREDFRYVPTLIFRTNAIWPSVLLILVASGILAVERNGNNLLVQFALAIVGNGIPFIPAVVSGFLAPRAAWLAGALVTLLGLLVPLVVLRDYLGGVKVDAGTVAQVLLASLVYGAAFGSASAWYKRFLNFLMAPSARGGGSGARRAPAKGAARSSKTAVAGRRRA